MPLCNRLRNIYFSYSAYCSNIVVMKVTRRIHVTSDEFFDYLEDSIVNLANRNNPDGNFTAADIRDGMIVDASENPDVRVEKTKILRYRRGEVYKWVTTYNYTKVTSTFSVEEAEDGDGIMVTYEQINPAYDNQKMNKILKGFSDILMLSRMTNMIYDSQRTIIARRPGVYDPAYEKEQKLKKDLKTQATAVQNLGKKIFADDEKKDAE